MVSHESATAQQRNEPDKVPADGLGPLQVIPVFNAPMKFPRSTAIGPSGLRPIGLSLDLYLTFIILLAPTAAFLAWGDCFLREYSRECVEQRIPDAARRVGFHFGSLPVPDEEKSRWALLEIPGGGPLSRAGFRSGDIPISVTDFCAALSADTNSPSEQRTVVVVNVVDWNSGDPSKWRQLTLPGATSHE